MIGGGDRRPAEPVGRRRNTWPGLTGAAGDLSRMRIIGIDSCASGGGTRERQSGRSGRKLLALAGDIAGANRAAADILNQFEQVAVLNLLDAVGQYYKPAIDLIEFAAFKLVSQLFAAQSERVAAGVLAQHQPRIRHPDRLG